MSSPPPLTAIRWRFRYWTTKRGPFAPGVASAVAVPDPKMVVIGGEVGSNPRLVDSVRHYAASLVPDLPDVVASALADRAVLQGEIVVALQSVWSRILSGIRTPG